MNVRSSSDCEERILDGSHLTFAMDIPIKSNIDHIVYCLEKYQITILATEYDIGNIDLMQNLEELGWSSKGIIALVESNNNSLVSAAEKFCFGKSSMDTGNSTTISITEECLLRELFLDPLLTNFGIVIMTEAQNRTVLTDTILALIKKILRKRSTLKLILVSTPKEAHFLSEYFNTHKEKNKEIKSAIISITSDDGSVKQDVLYLKTPCADYVQQTIHTIRNIHAKQTIDGDIIAYLADEDEISDAMELLKNYINSESITNLNYFKLSHMKNDRSVFFPTVKGKRNVVFTIELYQSSVTQDRISYVIDCGFMHLHWYEASLNRNQRLIVPVCKFTATLRAKWRNKYRMAKVFRLYTKDDFHSLPERTVVEMRRSELSSMILFLKTLAVDNILRFDFPSIPPAKNILATLETLYGLGALDDRGLLTYPLGYFMSECPFPPNLSRALYNSPEMHCSDEILTIVVMLQVEPVFIVTTNNMADRHKQVAKRAFEASEGDLITLLNVYNAFVENMYSKDFCRKYYLNYRNLMRAKNLKDHLISTLLQKYRMRLVSSARDIEPILRCITQGLFMNIAYLHPSGTYRALRCGSELFIDRDSSIYSLTQPKYLVYCELCDKSKLFMRNVTVIQEEWLDEIAPHYYKRKCSQ